MQHCIRQENEDTSILMSVLRDPMVEKVPQMRMANTDDSHWSQDTKGAAKTDCLVSSSDCLRRSTLNTFGPLSRFPV